MVRYITPKQRTKVPTREPYAHDFIPAARRHYSKLTLLYAISPQNRTKVPTRGSSAHDFIPAAGLHYSLCHPKTGTKVPTCESHALGTGPLCPKISQIFYSSILMNYCHIIPLKITFLKMTVYINSHTFNVC